MTEVVGSGMNAHECLSIYFSAMHSLEIVATIGYKIISRGTEVNSLFYIYFRKSQTHKE